VRSGHALTWSLVEWATQLTVPRGVSVPPSGGFGGDRQTVGHAHATCVTFVIVEHPSATRAVR
jgi:hypothetical protein